MERRMLEVPLRCREEGQVKARQHGAGRRALLWACIGVCSVLLVKGVTIGGLGASTFSLLDPRYGGVDGLGVLASRRVVPARQQELATVGDKMDSFRAARTVVPTHGVAGSVFGDDAPGRLPGVNQNAWLSSKEEQGVHFFGDRPRFVRAVHPRRPSMLRRVDTANAEGKLARLRSHRAPSALARVVSRTNILRERARLAAMNNRNNAVGALGRLQSKPQLTTQQFLKSSDSVDNWAGGTLFRASTTSTSTQGSLSPNFRSDEGNANGALAAVHGDKSWAEPAHDNGWASPVKDNSWASSVKDNGWATASKQTGWASAVHDNGWASSPSAATSHGALMSMKDANPMGSLSQLKGHQDSWAKQPSRNEDIGGLASMASGDSRGSLAQFHGGNNKGSLAQVRGGNNKGSLAVVRGRENSMGSLSAVKTTHVNSMGSLASVKTDPETNGALSNFKQNQAETDGSLSSFKDSLDSTDGSLAGLKASNSAGSLANTKGSDAGGSLADVKSSDVWGSLSNAKGTDMANGVLSVTKNGQDVGGSLSGFSYGKDGEHVGGSLANTKSSDVGGSLADVKSTMVKGALEAVGGHVDKSEMVGGSLSAVADRPQGNGWLSKAPGLRGRLVERGAGDAAKQAPTKSAARMVEQSAKQVQETEEEAAALKYMLGKELSEATEKRAALVAEQKVKKQKAALERMLQDSKKQMERVQSKLAKAAELAAHEAKGGVKGAKPTPAVASKAEGKGATMKNADAKVPSQHGSKTAAKAAAGVDEVKMHVANGQLKKQRKSTKLGEEGEPLDGNEDDIGWHKTHWSTVAWVMFIMFGPVFTTAVVGLVGYYTGTVAALATCLLLVCMDIACYYYSWFLW